MCSAVGLDERKKQKTKENGLMEVVTWSAFSCRHSPHRVVFRLRGPVAAWGHINVRAICGSMLSRFPHELARASQHPAPLCAVPDATVASEAMSGLLGGGY